jgi:hypothetical protein
VLKAIANNPTATNVFFTNISLADKLPYYIVYGKCYGDLNKRGDGRFLLPGVGGWLLEDVFGKGAL